MHSELSTAVRNHKEKRSSLAKVSNVERQLWKSVQSMGLLNADVRTLYRKACGLYEKIFLEDNETEELQETEYSLWKLHYKQIDEFRKQTSSSIQEGFKLFLEESYRFYKDLISKFKRYYGFEDRILFYHNHVESTSSSVEYSKLHKCRLVCHRLLVRLGDISRYLEVNQNGDVRKGNWCSVAQCYFEAAKMYPDSGNPQNQLALLATPAYIGDEFLALYHCVRSIAVKEPFPDASDNLLFIFERNMSAHIHSLSVGSQFDFLKPSRRVDFRATEADCYSDADLWSLFVRLTSFFFLEFSMESFSCTFSSTIRKLEELLALEDALLSITLESYQNVKISKPGPYRALQLISVLIFTVHNLSGNPEVQCQKKLQMALIVTFICMGRILERCLKGISTNDFLLLPTVLVFSEWLVENTERVEKCEIDENVMCAVSYLFSSYVELLNHLLECKNGVESPNNVVALWEDFEMRGFVPVLQCHSSLDFFTHCENETDFRAKNEYRILRIIQAAIKIGNRSADGTLSWIFFYGGKFYTKESHSIEEQEEDIVFKPNDRNSSAEIRKGPEQPAYDESLRRASTLLIAQNRALIQSLTSNTGISGTYQASPSPPSLSSWVFNGNTESSADVTVSNYDPRFWFVGSTGYNYCAPTPSAPLLPEDANWSKLSSYIEPPPPPPPRPRILRARKNLHFTNRVEQRFPVIPTPAVYTESPVSMHPTNAFFEQHTGYERSKAHVYETELKVGENQQQLLQYLKEKEWRIQQEAQITNYTNTRS